MTVVRKSTWILEQFFLYYGYVNSLNLRTFYLSSWMIIVMFQTTKSVETLICKNTLIFKKVLFRNKLFENQLEIIDSLKSKC